MQALVLTGEPLPLPGHVTTGAGLRAWGLCQGLRANGIDAWVATRRVAMPDIAEAEAREHHALFWEPDNAAKRLSDWDPACVVAQHWGHLRDVPPIEAPLAIDLAGPHLLERQLWGASDWTADLEEKLAGLRRADFAVCSGERQRLYFMNHLAMAGFDLTEHTLPVIPFSVSPDLPSMDRHRADHFIYGGMFLPWQDPGVGLEATLTTMVKLGKGHLDFCGGPHPRLDVSQGRFEGLMKRLEQSPRVNCHGLTSFDGHCADLSSAGVALDLMARNPERELAYTTRTVLYLWAGLPVIHGDFDELGALIAETESGWSIAPEQAEATVAEILENPDMVAERGANAQRLVRERLTWDKTIEPLAAWCREPMRRENKLAVNLTFESKDREITDLRLSVKSLRSEIDTIQGKLSWQFSQSVLSLRWLWASIIWLLLLPVSLALVLMLAATSKISTREKRETFPGPQESRLD